MEYVAKAVFSRVSLTEREHRLSKHYNETVSDLLCLPEVKKLDENLQHMKTSRLQHCVNVSYYSFRLARFFGIDAKAAARAGLLHDMYYYDYKGSNLSVSEHSELHPQLALENARSITEISKLEEDIILTHMWPMTRRAPKSAEGFVVTLADKLCTVFELVTKLWGGTGA